ncbi:MAG: hypothetical protein GF399_00625 [Candidatus Coatesbacteria bacterium]|nr:hypothetical protein [Candidatus Coatesbacteria bacterium]
MRLLKPLFVLVVFLVCLAGCDGQQPADEAEEPVEEASAGEVAPGGESTPPPAAEDQDDKEQLYSGTYVYVTEHGGKYHAPDCQHVAGHDNLRRMSRERALAEGYEPCKVCRPGYQQ